MSLGTDLAALPPAALPARLAALRWTDLGLDLAALLPARGYHSLTLHHDARCEVGLFFLRAGQQIPLHDHPAIDVWMRVLVGRLQATSYTWVERPLACRSADVILDPESPVWSVEPERDNLHRLLAHADVAFLDVLRPPYVDGRVCTYYEAHPAGSLWRLTPS
jgi:hypothetical protein